MKPVVQSVSWKLARGTLAALLGIVIAGCEVDSAEKAHRDVPIYVAGVYRHPSAGSLLVADNTGEPIEQIDLRQDGDALEGIDNNGSIFRGRIDKVDGSVASFTIKGINTAGNEGTIAGTISVDGSTAVMRGTWIEDALYSVVYGQATVPSNITCNLVLTIADTTLTNGQSTTLSVANGTAPFTWDVDGPAKLDDEVTTSPSNSLTYTGTNTEKVLVTVIDSRGCGATGTIN